jgi:hypothetical protein
MRVVTDEFEIFENKLVDVFDRRIQFYARQGSEIAGKLLARLVKMVVVEMQITKCVDEIAWLKINDLGHHHREQRVRCDIEWDTQEEIGATLIKLATEFSILDVKLEENVTRW